MNERNDDDEIEIDLAKMFASILRRWKMIVGWTVVLAVLVGVIASLKEYQSAKNQYSDENMEAITEKLTQTEIQEIKEIYSRYKAYQKLFRNDDEYMESSVLMTWNPNDIITENIGYIISSDQADTASTFVRYTLGDEEYIKIAAIYGEDVDSKYISEAISLYIEDSDLNDSINLQSEDGNSIFNGGTITNNYYKTLNVRIFGTSKEQCESIAGIINQAIDNYTQKLKNSGISVDITQISESCLEGYSQELKDIQQNVMTNHSSSVNEYKDFVSNNIDTLEEDQKNYYDFLVGRDNQKKIIISWKKYALFGALIGFILSILIAIILYLSEKDFRTEDEIQTAAYQISGTEKASNLLGFYHYDGNYHGLNKKVQKSADRLEYSSIAGFGEDEEKALSVTAMRIQKLCENVNVDKGSDSSFKKPYSVFLVRDYSFKYGKDIEEKLDKNLQKLDLIVKSGVPSKNANDLCNLQSADAAVILVTLHDQKRNEMESDLRVIHENNIPVLGCVIISQN